jgi:hypothetical protein
MKKHVSLSLIVAFFYLTACEEDIPVNPKIETDEIVVKSASDFTIKGTITTIGTIPVLDYGFIYARYQNPDLTYGSADKVSLGSEPVNGAFEKTISLLPTGSDYWSSPPTYYARAYLTNKKGTVYGTVKSFGFPTLSISSVVPLLAKAGDVITITGHNFSTEVASNVVKFNDVLGLVRTASATQLTVEVPAGIPSSYYDYSVTISVTAGAQQARYQGFKIMPTFTDFSPKSGTFGTSITVSGSNFYGHSFSATLGDISVSASVYNNNTLAFSLPSGITSETFKVIMVVDNNLAVELAGEFTMTKPVISSISPTTGIGGTLVSLTGSGFNTPDYYNTNNKVTFGSQQATVYSVSSTQIRAYVPSNLAPGQSYDVSVFTGVHTVTAPLQFTVGSPAVTDFSPKTATGNSYVNITGKNFSNVQGTVLFGAVQASIYSWNDTAIRAQVPSSGYLSPGTYKITVNAGGQSAVSTDSITIQ